MTFQSMETQAFATRRLRYAIVASLVLHLLLLSPDTSRLLTKDTPSPLQATLRLPPRPSPVLAPAEPALRAAPPKSSQEIAHRMPVAPTLASMSPAPKPSMLEQPKSPSVPQTPAAPAESRVKPSAGPASVPAAEPPTSSLPGGSAGAASGALLTDANAAGEAADGLRGYRLALASQARRFKRYPAQAMASGWAGSAEIRVEVGGDSRPRAATVSRSSGYEMLDRAALAMIDAGAARARLPESLRGRAFVVVLPVVFNLEDD